MEFSKGFADDLRGRLRAWTRENLSTSESGPASLESNARDLARRLGQEGFMAHAFPRAYGGARETVQVRELCAIREELASASALADVMFGVQALGGYPIVSAGSEEQKKTYLPALASGKSIAAFALTEADAGSDAAAIATKAARVAGGYRLKGSKRYISNAGIAHVYVVFASTDPSAKGKGISAFIVSADCAGLAVTEKTQLLSPHPIGSVAFDDCFVPESQRLGSEGAGLTIAFRTLDTLRATVGAHLQAPRAAGRPGSV